MKQVFDIITNLQSITGTNAKLNWLHHNKTNTDLRDYLFLVYDPGHNFYQSKVSKPDGVLYNNNGICADFQFFKRVATKLSQRTVTGNSAIDYLKDSWYILNNEPDRRLLEWMIDRDIKAGVSVSSINKVWPNLIKVVPYMRCDLPKNVKLHEWPWKRGVYSQVKCDGMFANITVTDDVEISSRSGSIFPHAVAFSGIITEIGSLPEGYQYHGELLVYKDGKVLPREVSNGILNSILQDGELPDDTHKVHYVIWDRIPIENAVAKGKYNVKYSQRYSDILGIFEFNEDCLEYISIVPTKVVYSEQEALEHYRGILSEGGEGTVIKHPDGIWEDKTSKHCIKFKLEAEIDLMVIGFNEGKGKNADTFGSMLCTSSDGQLLVSVTGIPDKLRKKISDNKDGYIFKIVSVICNGIMKPTGTNKYYSVFLPRCSKDKLVDFVEFRYDKKEADSLEKIQDIFDSLIQG